MIDFEKEEQRIAKLRETKDIKIEDLHYGDRVRFVGLGEETLIGTIEVKDSLGGGFYYGVCPSVDLMGEDGILYKHVPIVDVELL